MVLTLGADVQILFKLLLPDDLAAALALLPQALCAHTFIFGRLNLTGLPFKPGQGSPL